MERIKCACWILILTDIAPDQLCFALLLCVVCCVQVASPFGTESGVAINGVKRAYERTCRDVRYCAVRMHTCVSELMECLTPYG